METAPLVIPYFESFEAFVTLLLLFIASGWINRLVPDNKIVLGVIEARQLVSLVVSVALAIVASFIGDSIPGLTNFLSGQDLISAILYGLGGGLVANGMYKITTVKQVLSFIGAARAPKRE